MRFKPMTEEDAASINLMPKGEYDAVVKVAAEKVSKTNNDMFALQLTVYGPSGEQKTVFDYLVFTDGGHAKIQRFCKSADIWETYQAGEMSADGLRDLSVRVKIGIEDGSDGYPPKNKVVDYLPRKVSLPGPKAELPGVDPAQRRAAIQSAIERADDEIPF